jgi:hypothetical protein
MTWTRQLVSASRKPHKNCGWKANKTSIEHGERVSVAVNTIGNAYPPIFICFQESYSETNSFVFDLLVFRGVGNKSGWQTELALCHGSTVFYVPVRLLRTPHSSSQITDHYPSDVKPWTCVIKLDLLLFWFLLTVYIA